MSRRVFLDVSGGSYCDREEERKLMARRMKPFNITCEILAEHVIRRVATFRVFYIYRSTVSPTYLWGWASPDI